MVIATKPELQTRTLTGVEILAPGIWNGRPYTVQDLDDAVSAFTELKGKFDPPGKLGHDSDQELAKASSLGAIGWVSNLYRQGNTLLADFRDVPGKVAKLIAAKHYNKISSEIYRNLTVDDKVYPFVLRAVAFLGGAIPAVKDIKSIDDVAALFSELFEDVEPEFAVFADATAPDTSDDADAADMVAELDAYMARLETHISGNTGAKRIRTFLQTTRRELAGMKKASAAMEDDDMEIKKLAEALGLAETATEDEVLAAIAKAKTAPAPAALSETEARDLQQKVIKLEADALTRNATQAVDSAIEAGKFVPKQRDSLLTYAVKDLEGFSALAEATPKLAILSGPIGQDSHPNDPDADAEPTPAELALAREMHVAPEDIQRAKSSKSTAELAEEYRREHAKASA